MATGTPLTHAAEAYAGKEPARFHMPGHKGRGCHPVGAAARYDITEVAGADSLYEASGPIAETEAAYSALYGSAGTALSAGGSTLCIQTMLALAAKPGDKVICARGAHVAALNAMALLDLTPVWLFPEADPTVGLAGTVTPGQVEAALAAHPDTAAVYITSPTYYGLLSDIAGMAHICRAHRVPLLVDNAHGAHLKWIPGGLHPMDQGADMCCDSLHKTLPVLTGGAALHIGNPRFLPDAKRRMSLFGSTSPSYLILLSLDGALPYLRQQASGDLAVVTQRVAALSRLARNRGFLVPDGACDPIRLTLGFAPTGMDDAAFRAHLARHGVEPELCAGGHCVLLAGAGNGAADYGRLERAIARAPMGGSDPIRESLTASGFPPPEQAVSLREAMLGDSEPVALEQAEGRIAAGAVAPCPPGILVAAPGERLTGFVLDALKNSGILSVDVLKLNQRTPTLK